MQPLTRTLYPKFKCFLQLWHEDRGFASRGLEASSAESRCSALPLRAAPFQASLTLPPWHSFPDTFRFTQSVKEKHFAEACAISRGCKCGGHGHTLGVFMFMFTEQVVFTSVYKVKPSALILRKSKTTREVHDSEGLVQIFAK